MKFINNYHKVVRNKRYQKNKIKCYKIKCYFLYYHKQYYLMNKSE